MSGIVRDVDPGALHVPPDRPDGADPFKLQRQYEEFGASAEDMPIIEVTLGQHGEMMINDGVTRATRCWVYNPKATVPVRVVDVRPAWDFSHLPTIAETLNADF